MSSSSLLTRLIEESSRRFQTIVGKSLLNQTGVGMTFTTIPAQGSLQRYPFSTTASVDRHPGYKPVLAGHKGEQHHILTLFTDTNHSESMTSLRQKYFPQSLNKLDAHITLFHALPESKLSSEILPAIQEIAARTDCYQIRATEPFRLSKGIGIRVADDIEYAKKGRDGRGRNMTRIIHSELRKKWSEWLSEQDSSPPKLHYTVMNKVNDESAIEQALKEIKMAFPKQGSSAAAVVGHRSAGMSQRDGQSSTPEDLVLDGKVQGLTLWRYEQSGHWTNPEHFPFRKTES